MKNLVLPLLIVLCTLGFFSSCSSIKDEIELLHIDEYLKISVSHEQVCNGDTLNIAVALDKEKSSVEIEKVRFYWDNENIALITSEPFELHYPIEDQSLGIHKLKILIFYKEKKETPWSVSIDVVSEALKPDDGFEQ